MNKPSSYLELIIGPMMAGKTSKLIDIYHQYKVCDVPVVVINHVYDEQRFGNIKKNEMISHDSESVGCIYLKNLQDFSSRFDAYKAILINEGQFFTDLVPVVLDLLKKDKHVFIASLDSDFKGNRFGDVIDLIPVCDVVCKLTSLCVGCKNGTKAIFSKRVCVDAEENQILIGDSNKYIPVCRNCFKK
jgi:thymidine kinase